MSHRALVIATLTVVALCGLVASALEHWWVGRPLQLLRDKARRAGAGDFSGPLELHQRDEIGELAREINAMCARIATANSHLSEESEARVAALEQLRHTDRLASIGQIAAGIAHELGTPLNVVSASAELIADTDLPRAEVVRSARTIVQQTDRMATIIRQLLDFSRRRGHQRSETDLRQLVVRTVDLIRGIASKLHVTIDCDAGPTPAMVALDPNQMQQALMNLLMNGVQAMPNGGHLRVSIGAQRLQLPAGSGAAAADYWCVTVEDEGMGIASADRERLFEPFFTTKQTGEGTGLGLPVAHDIVTEHGGWITVDSVVGRGTRFTIVLPRADRAHGSTVAA